MRYQVENDALLTSLLKRTFFASWARPRGELIPNYDKLEFIITPDCNLDCTYCYLSRHGDELYPLDIRDPERVLEHLDIVLNWLFDNRLKPNIEFFSGSPLSQEITLAALEQLCKRYAEVPRDLRPKQIVVPTNYTWMLDDDLTGTVEDFIARFQELDISLLLSASFDGKHMEANRPRRREADSEGIYLFEGLKRDDQYYDKVFAFNKKYGFGFHPMVYSRGIESWIENFQWFQEMFAKHDIPFWSLYLLEVRNPEWSEAQMQSFEEFIEFLVLWAWDRVDKDSDRFRDFMVSKRGFNILINSLWQRARGTTCGIQTALYARMGDLALVPCHRTSYAGFEFGKFRVDGGKITGVEARNLELALGVFSLHTQNQTMCEQCLLKGVCPGGCLGAQLETVGDVFTPIPTVCELMHRKLYTILVSLKSIGQYDNITGIVPEHIQQVYKEILKLGG